MQPSIGLDFGFAKPLLTLLLCGLQLIVDLKLGIGAKPDDFGIKFLLGFLTASGIDDTHPLHLGGCLRHKLFSLFTSAAHHVGMLGLQRSLPGVHIRQHFSLLRSDRFRLIPSRRN
ncbi:Uncharacterised protein [Mycobacterium tuberculosis]|nr:Uncharacterised protein [Mycobacterium tuberculosis]